MIDDASPLVNNRSTTTALDYEPVDEDEAPADTDAPPEKAEGR